MDTFEPLVELRGEWRSAAAISIPSAAAQVAAALDRALDVLVDAEQVDEESLTMAAEMVCKAVVARADEVELLRRRLHRAIRDYVSVTAIDAAPMDTDSSAFESEEALAAALFASVGDSIGGLDDLFDAEVAAADTGATGGKKRIDERALRKSLAHQPGQTKKTILNIAKLLILVLIVLGMAGYVLTHLPQEAPAPVAACTAPTAPSGGQAGCFKGGQAVCTSGTAGNPPTVSCSWTVNASGQLPIKLSWNTKDTLAVALLKNGLPYEPGPSTAQSAAGQVTLTLPNVPSGSYTLLVTDESPSTAASPPVIQFTVAVENVSAGS